MPHPHEQARNVVVLLGQRRRRHVHQLLREAQAARLLRMMEAAAEGEPSRERAGAVLCAAIDGAARADPVDCASYLSRVATAQQLAAGRISRMHTSLGRFLLNASAAKALAAAVSETMHFVDASARGLVDVYLTTAMDGGRLVIALGVRGTFGVVGPVSSARALDRAMRIVSALGGCFGRGATEDQMTIGITLPVLFDDGLRAFHRGRG